MALWGVFKPVSCCWSGAISLCFRANSEVFRRRAGGWAESELVHVWVVSSPQDMAQSPWTSLTSKYISHGEALLLSAHCVSRLQVRTRLCRVCLGCLSQPCLQLGLACRLGQPWDGFLAQGVHGSTLILKWNKLFWLVKETPILSAVGDHLTLNCC